MQPFGYCPKCHCLKPLTEHHVFPRRFFHRNNSKLRICRDCHDEIELLLPYKKKLSKGEYINVTKSWLRGNMITLKDVEDGNYMEDVATASPKRSAYSMQTLQGLA